MITPPILRRFFRLLREINPNLRRTFPSQDFTIPDVMPFDFMSTLGNDKRPPYRWFCIGPRRSGTTVHKDPLGTSAWNAVTSGVKRWVLFEPHVDKKIAKGAKMFRKPNEDDEGIDYFANMLPRIRQHILDNNLGIKVHECLQFPGDVIFVPASWWHGVVNLTDAVAITQNFCGYAEFDLCYKYFRKQRPGLLKRWLRALKEDRLELWERAMELEKVRNVKRQTKNKEGTGAAGPAAGEENATDDDSDVEISSDSSSSSSSSSDDEDDINLFGVAGEVTNFRPPWVPRSEWPLWKKQLEQRTKKQREAQTARLAYQQKVKAARFEMRRKEREARAEKDVRLASGRVAAGGSSVLGGSSEKQ